MKAQTWEKILPDAPPDANNNSFELQFGHDPSLFVCLVFNGTFSTLHIGYIVA